MATKFSQKRLEAAAEAGVESARAFHKAQRTVPMGLPRLAAFAAQAEVYLGTIERLGMLEHPECVTFVRQGRRNIATYNAALAASQPPAEVEAVVEPAAEGEAA